MPCKGSLALQSTKKYQKWPTREPSGYVTLASWGVSNAKAGDQINNGPQVGLVATLPLPFGESPRLGSMVQIKKWPTNGFGGYVTPAVVGESPRHHRRGPNSMWPTSMHGGCHRDDYLATWVPPLTGSGSAHNSVQRGEPIQSAVAQANGRCSHTSA